MIPQEQEGFVRDLVHIVCVQHLILFISGMQWWMVHAPPFICLLKWARVVQCRVLNTLWLSAHSVGVEKVGVWETRPAFVWLGVGGRKKERMKDGEREKGTTERARRSGSNCRQWHGTLMTERQWEEQKLRRAWAVWYKHTTLGTESPFYLLISFLLLAVRRT